MRTPLLWLGGIALACCSVCYLVVFIEARRTNRSFDEVSEELQQNASNMVFGFVGRSIKTIFWVGVWATVGMIVAKVVRWAWTS